MAELPPSLAVLSQPELERLCTDCGACCVASLHADDRKVFVPDLPCRFLRVEDGKSRCAVYSDRHALLAGRCLDLAEALERRVFPDSCPYTHAVAGYTGPEVLHGKEYDAVLPVLRASLRRIARPTCFDPETWDAFVGDPK